jgi:hypothetical protein
MTVETVTGCTARQSNDYGGTWPALGCSGGACGQAHGVAKLGVAHELAGERRRWAQLTAELADDAGEVLVQMHSLTHERRARAVNAAVAVLAERADPAAQQVALELLNVAGTGARDHHW